MTKTIRHLARNWLPVMLGVLGALNLAFGIKGLIDGSDILDCVISLVVAVFFIGAPVFDKSLRHTVEHVTLTEAWVEDPNAPRER